MFKLFTSVRTHILGLLVGFACCVTIAPDALSKASVRIVGTVIDQDSAPLASAAIECMASGRMLTRGAEPVDLGGRFNIQVSSDATHVTCKISAHGHQSRTQTAPVRNGEAILPGVKLEKLARLEISSWTKNLTPDGKYLVFDALVSNPSSKPVDVIGLQVNGAALVITNCFDPRPAVAFKVDDRVPLRRVSATDLPTTVDLPPTNWSESIAAKGHIELLGCEQKRLTIDINYLLHFDPGNREKLRIALPRRLSVEDENSKVVDLATWEALQIKLRLADGSSIQNSTK
jgi:hypothetical protein